MNNLTPKGFSQSLGITEKCAMQLKSLLKFQRPMRDRIQVLRKAPGRQNRSHDPARGHVCRGRKDMAAAGWKVRLGRRSGHFLVCGSQGGHGRLSDDPACLDIPQSISGPWL